MRPRRLSAGALLLTIALLESAASLNSRFCTWRRPHVALDFIGAGSILIRSSISVV